MHMCVHTGRTCYILIFFPLSHKQSLFSQGTLTKARGIELFQLLEMIFFFKLNILAGRCPVDKQRNNHPFSEDFVRMVLSSCPSHIFPIKFEPVGIKCLHGMAGYSSRLFCTYSAACLAIGLVSQSTRIYWAFMWQTRQIHSLSSCSYVLRGLSSTHNF